MASREEADSGGEEKERAMEDTKDSHLELRGTEIKELPDRKQAAYNGALGT